MNDSSDFKFDQPLPPELLAASLTFNEWSQAQLLANQRKSTPAKALYHYTDADAPGAF